MSAGNDGKSRGRVSTAVESWVCWRFATAKPAPLLSNHKSNPALPQFNGRDSGNGCQRLATRVWFDTRSQENQCRSSLWLHGFDYGSGWAIVEIDGWFGRPLDHAMIRNNHHDSPMPFVGEDTDNLPNSRVRRAIAVKGLRIGRPPLVTSRVSLIQMGENEGQVRIACGTEDLRQHRAIRKVPKGAAIEASRRHPSRRPGDCRCVCPEHAMQVLVARHRRAPETCLLACIEQSPCLSDLLPGPARHHAGPWVRC